MSDPKSKPQRLIGLLYWAVWGWLALAVAFCAAAATWIEWELTVPLTILGLVITLTAGTWSVLLLTRDAALHGRRRLRILLFVAAGLAYPAGAALVVTTLWWLPDVWRSSWLDLLQGVWENGLGWGWRFTLYQAVVFLVAASLVIAAARLAVGLLGRAGARRRGITPLMFISRWRLAATAVAGALLVPVLLFWGYEASRRAGMTTFMAIHADEADALAARVLERLDALPEAETNKALAVSAATPPRGKFGYAPESGPFAYVDLDAYAKSLGLSLPFPGMNSTETSLDLYSYRCLVFSLTATQVNKASAASAWCPLRPVLYVIYRPRSWRFPPTTTKTIFLGYTSPGIEKRHVWGRWYEDGASLAFRPFWQVERGYHFIF